MMDSPSLTSGSKTNTETPKTSKDGIGNTNAKKTSDAENFLSLELVGDDQGLCVPSLLTETDYLKDLTVKYKSEKNLRKPLKYISLEELQGVYDFIEHQTKKLYEPYIKLQKNLKISVEKVIKKRKGVIPIRISNQKAKVKAYLVHIKSLEPPPNNVQNPKSQQQTLTISQSISKVSSSQTARISAPPPKLIPKPTGILNGKYISKSRVIPKLLISPKLKKSLNVKSKPSKSSETNQAGAPKRLIRIPKRYSEGLGKKKLVEENENNKRKGEEKLFEMGLLPPKFPKSKLFGLMHSGSEAEMSNELKSSTTGKEFTGDTLFQISAMRLSGEFDVATLTSEYMGNEQEVCGGNGEGSTEFTSTDSKEKASFSEKLTTPKIDIRYDNPASDECKLNQMKIPCSARWCRGFPSAFPDMQCVRCLCLFHAKCLPLSVILKDKSSYLCSECKSKENHPKPVASSTVTSSTVQSTIAPKLAFQLPEGRETVQFNDLDITLVPSQKGHVIVTKPAGATLYQRLLPKAPPTGQDTFGKRIMKRDSVQHIQIINNTLVSPSLIAPNVGPPLQQPTSLSVTRIPSLHFQNIVPSNPITYNVADFPSIPAPRLTSLKPREKLHQSPPKTDPVHRFMKIGSVLVRVVTKSNKD